MDDEDEPTRVWEERWLVREICSWEIDVPMVDRPVLRAKFRLVIAKTFRPGDEETSENPIVLLWSDEADAWLVTLGDVPLVVVERSLEAVYSVGRRDGTLEGIDALLKQDPADG